MKTQLKLEEAAQFAIATYLFYQLGYSWWVFPACILLPDLSMLGYLINPKIGAFLYNLFHSKTLALCICLAGLILQNQPLQGLGLLLYAHSSMDRVFGYGLKYPDSFNNTHLGVIGKA